MLIDSHLVVTCLLVYSLQWLLLAITIINVYPITSNVQCTKAKGAGSLLSGRLTDREKRMILT